jgi:hypothetical protein
MCEDISHRKFYLKYIPVLRIRDNLVPYRTDQDSDLTPAPDPAIFVSDQLDIIYIILQR